MYPIVTLTDKKHLSSTQFLLESIISNYKLGKRIKFYILYFSKDISENEINNFLYYFDDKTVDIKFVNSDDLESLDTIKIFESYEKRYNEYISVVGKIIPSFKTLRKIWIQDSIPEDKILFLDSDTFLFDDIEHIFNFQTKHYFSAVLEPWPITFPHYHNIFLQKVNNINLFNTEYFKKSYLPLFNSGVFLTSLNYWKKNNLLDKTKQFMKEFLFLYGDQDLLNYFFLDNFSCLPNQFNALFKTIYEAGKYINYNSIPDRPILIHFSGCFKPIYKTFDNYTLLDNSKSNILPENYNNIIMNSYNKIKRKVLIKELFINILKKKSKDILDDELMYLVNNENDIYYFEWLMKKNKYQKFNIKK